MTSIDVQTSFSNELNNKENKDEINNNPTDNNTKKKSQRTKNNLSTEKSKIRITKKTNYFSKDFWPEKIITGDFCNGLQKGSLLGLPRMVQITQINNRMNKKMIENSWKYQKEKKPKPKKPSKLMQLFINQFYSEENKK
jgi:hypothetical protein